MENALIGRTGKYNPMIPYRRSRRILRMKIVTVAGILLGLGLAVRACAAEPVRENIEWLDVWLPHTNEHSLPRILLIGDSITRGYGKQVEANLKDKAYVGRMATSKSLGDPALVEQVILILREQSFDIIHFNNGMHGDGYGEEAYAEALPELVAALRRNAPRARLIWCSTTDVRERNNLSTLVLLGHKITI
jgi:hypothetical protein